ncbi:Uncharacterised protein [Yersinia thracica]|uniref:Uncharacterized protein n=1 Tax=Yersinia thracica TaxID=2890319 RepID=A0A0T9QPW6_9GAMM|nr:Uncharacterised protein [Yersinia thracica]
MLAALTYPNHLPMQAHRDAFVCCLAATPITLGNLFLIGAAAVLAALSQLIHMLLGQYALFLPLRHALFKSLHPPLPTCLYH